MDLTKLLYEGGSLVCIDWNLSSLKGCPERVYGSCSFARNELRTIEDGPMIVNGNYSVVSNLLISLEGIGRKYTKQIDGYLYLQGNAIKSNVLGILLIKNLIGIQLNNSNVEKILKKHIIDEGDLLECQEDLIQSGHKRYARL